MNFDRRGFTPAYECEADPEFPADGEWRIPAFAYARDQAHAIPLDSFASTWGTPHVLRVQPEHSQGWVGYFAAGGLGGLTTASALPNPNQLLVVSDGFPYILDVRDPRAVTHISFEPIRDIAAAPAAQGLVLAGFTELALLDDSGLAWKSRRLCADDLGIDRIEDARIYASGDFVGPRDQMIVDAITGEVVAGRVFDLW